MKFSLNIDFSGNGFQLKVIELILKKIFGSIFEKKKNKILLIIPQKVILAKWCFRKNHFDGDSSRGNAIYKESQLWH